MTPERRAELESELDETLQRQIAEQKLLLSVQQASRTTDQYGYPSPKWILKCMEQDRALEKKYHDLRQEIISR